MPEQALEELLRKAEKSNLTDFLKQQAPVIATGKSYMRRQRSAFWSIMWLSLSTFFALIALMFSWRFVDLLSLGVLGTLTYYEVKVHQLFRDGDPKGAILGYHNQCAFAVFFVVYAVYQSFSVTVPPELAQATSPAFSSLYVTGSRCDYAFIGLVCAAGQYMLAIFYRSTAPATTKPVR